MMKMTTAQRRDIIFNKLTKDGFVTISDLSSACSVSEMTIRRDLDLLAKSGLLHRTHGGAGPIRTGAPARVNLIEPRFDDRSTVNVGKKQAIAQAASRLVFPGQTIALDIGTTTAYLAAEVSQASVSIYTCSVKIAARLSDARPMVYLPCGLVHGTEPSIIGALAVEHLRGLNFDTVFLGASGMSENGACFDYSLEDTETKRALIESARETVMLLDSSKFGQTSVVQICEASQIDMLITDATPPPAILARLKAADVEIVIAT